MARQHNLVSKHVKISEKERKELFERYSIGLKEIPKIVKDDPAIAELGAEAGDIIKITRKSPTRGETTYYRGVINE